MSENRQPGPDPLEEAVRAFQGMAVGERPADAAVLARLGVRPGDRSEPACTPGPSKRRHLMPLIASAAAAAVLLFGGLALLLRNSSPPEPVRVAAAVSPGKGRDGSVPPPAGKARSLRESLRRHGLAHDVAEARVIVVATALDSAPAPARRPGDLPETMIRFRVKRVLKGKLNAKQITTRTPTAAGEFLGKDWIILLSPDYMAGKYQYASHINIKLEPTVKAILSGDKK